MVDEALFRFLPIQLGFYTPACLTALQCAQTSFEKVLINIYLF